MAGAMIGYLFLYTSILYPESQSLIGIIILGKTEQRSVIVNRMREQIQSNLRYIHLKMLLGLHHYNEYTYHLRLYECHSLLSPLSHSNEVQYSN